MTGRHVAKADGQAVSFGMLLYFLGSLAALALLIYLLVSVHTAHRELVITAAIAVLAWIVIFVMDWRQARRLRWIPAAGLLAQLIGLVSVLAPPWHWLRFGAYAAAVAGVVGLIKLFGSSGPRRETAPANRHAASADAARSRFR